MNEIFVRVKMCGNCNPRYDPMTLLKKVSALDSRVRFVFGDDVQAPVCKKLYLNGCEVGCEQEEASRDVTVVSGFMINGRTVAEEELAAALTGALTAP